MDKIVYIARSLPGGIDGMSSDSGGRLEYASFKPITEKDSGNFPWWKIEPIVINVDTRREEALAKLDPIDRLILGL